MRQGRAAIVLLLAACAPLLAAGGDTPLANLHLTLLDRFGVHWDRLGDSTGRVDDRQLGGL